MKMSKIKEVLLKKRLVLEEICRGAHMIVDGQFEANLSIKSIESGTATSSRNKRKNEAAKQTLNKILPIPSPLNIITMLQGQSVHPIYLKN